MDDRIALRIILAIFTVLALLYARPSAAADLPGLVPGDHCNARGEQRDPWSREDRERTQERVDIALADLRVSRAVVAYHRAIVCREAFCGESDVRHTLGRDGDGAREDGLGTYGLSLRWHAGKWGADADPAFCTPEVSTAVAHELIWRAVTRYGASTLLEVQSVYAGAVERRGGAWLFTLSPRKRDGLCRRLDAFGVDCRAPIGVEDLGRRLDADDRRAWALGLARRFVAGWLGR